jgi:hypothetical protein
MKANKNNLQICAVLQYTEPKEQPYYLEVTPSFDSIEELQNYVHQNMQTFTIRTSCIVDAMGWNIFYCKLVIAIKNIETGTADLIDFDRRTLLN